MKYRICDYTGLGGNAEVYLDRQGNIPEDAIAEIVEIFNNGCDWHSEKDYIAFGIEPTYQGDRLYIFYVKRDINESFILRGKAWGAYGTNVVKTIKKFSDYKYKSKLVKAITRIHHYYFEEKEIPKSEC